ncbi:dihydrolipoamide acetyltransferase family protein [Vannielia sp.]|uniref:dihydrolipoamide acetyltransferase family protein n=1 Tax=Vannielia sp. TaxID=2813045 RepID=UPI002601B35A|nr:dihydrolipoamide acetyltransferase family protein [Vannielia sp.]MDF1873495.1 dihydrolipoamide acetyltransferase family protein [Vannielia sp.]
MTDLVMPKFGLTMTEGLLTEWHVAPGAAFHAGDVLFTVETEKVANDVEAEADGVLAEIVVAEGESVPVGEPVARLAQAGDDAGSAGEQTQSAPPVLDPAPIPAPAADTEDAPSARKLMAEHDLAREQVPPSGRNGRVTKGDVLRVIATPLARNIAAKEGLDLHSVEGSGPMGRIKARDVEGAAKLPPRSQPAATPEPAPAREITPDAARLATARRVSAAKRDIPHFYVTHEAELSALTGLRKQLNADPDAPRVSVTHMLIRALGVALSEHPAMNRIWAGDKIVAFSQANIGMVTQTPDGLRIPVIRDAGGATLDDIATQARDLAARARSGELGASDVGDGVISISNVGMMGVTSLTPIINPPNAMILGVGAERQLFRPDENGAPALRRELTLTLACDHRIIDGADAATFLAEIVALLETPLRLLRPARGTADQNAGD